MAHTETTDALILHHYEASPYAEKIRLMLGWKGLRWRSVLSPPQPPRPNVDPLTGGYRRIPVAQIGADVFCDTFVIAQELAGLADAPELDPERMAKDAAELAAHAEGEVFFAAIGSVPPATLLGTMLRTVGPIGLVRFALDRARMMRDASVRPAQGDAARAVMRDFLGELEQRLSGADHLGSPGPSLVDFAAFHPLWLHVSVRRKPLDARYVRLVDWYQRMEALGHGTRVELEPEQAFEAARSAEPRPLPESGEADAHIGRRVSVAPTDYGTDPVVGTLVASTPSRWILARETERLGTLHVHFPRRGFSLTEA